MSMGSLQKLNELIQVKHREPCLACGKQDISLLMLHFFHFLFEIFACF